MEAGQGFVETLPVYTIMPNPRPYFVASVKLSTELLEHLQSKAAATTPKTICFGPGGNIISLGNEQFSFRSSAENVVNDCYHQEDDDDGSGGTFSKVGVVKRKLFVTQKLREEDRKRVKNATETHEKERRSHKSVLLPDATGDHFVDKKRKLPTVTSSKLSSLTIKRPRTASDPPPVPKPQLASLSSLAAKHTPASTSVPSGNSSLLGSPLRRPPLRVQIIQMLAIEPLSYDHIEPKCTATKTALASTLQQVAKLKDGQYHLKKEMYKEVDPNWVSYTPEEKTKVIERKNLALKPEAEQKAKKVENVEEAKAAGVRHPSLARAPPNGKASSETAKEEVVTTSASKQSQPLPSSAGRRVDSREGEQKDRPSLVVASTEPSQTKRRSVKQPSPPSSTTTSTTPISGPSVSKAKDLEMASLQRRSESKPKTARTESVQPVLTKNNSPDGGKDTLMDDEYRKRRAEWEKKYEEYCELHRKLKENAQRFQQLGSRLRRASESEKGLIVQQITNEYQRQITRVQQMKKRLSVLHSEIKREKAALLAQPRK